MTEQTQNEQHEQVVKRLMDQVNQQQAQIDELSHHKAALDASFMEQLQMNVNQKVDVSKLRTEVQKSQQAMAMAQQGLIDKQKEIDDLKLQLKNLQAVVEEKVNLLNTANARVVELESACVPSPAPVDSQPVDAA